MRVNHWTKRWKRKPTISWSSAEVAIPVYLSQLDDYPKHLEKVISKFVLPTKVLK